VLFLTGRAGRLADLLTERALRPHGLDRSQLAALVALASAGDDGSMSPGELAALLAQTPSGVTRTVKRLERDRLVARDSDPSDGRAVLLRLTPAGETRMAGAMTDLLEQFEGQLHAAGPIDLLPLVRALETVDGLFEPLPGAPATAGPEVASEPNPGPHDDGVGGRIRGLRAGHGLSQRQLARQVGIGAPHLSKLERGLEQPSEAVLTRIAHALGADANELLLCAGLVPHWMVDALAADPGRAVRTLGGWTRHQDR
jgi:DNA-binding MarR family transcriptional regulator/DNA-binding XRE family transcriptional regulator